MTLHTLLNSQLKTMERGEASSQGTDTAVSTGSLEDTLTGTISWIENDASIIVIRILFTDTADYTQVGATEYAPSISQDAKTLPLKKWHV